MRSDREILIEINELIAGLPVESDDVAVTVAAGIVTLRGIVEARIDAAVLATMVEDVAGVARVDNTLDWLVDTRVPELKYPGYPQEGATTRTL